MRQIFISKHKNGFTLVELLVVIAIIAILFAVVLVAINPAQRFKDSRNARRLSDVKSIVEAATTYTADRRGSQLPDVPDYQCVGSKPATVVSDTSPVPRAHWKFDNDANSSVGSFNGTTSETNYSNPAKLIQGLILQNPLYGVSVSDTVDDTLINALTVEGWMKLNQKIEPGTFDHHQALFDKGNYRLQINSDSGKLEFSTRPTSGGAIPTEYTAAADNLTSINSLMQFQGDLYGGASRSTEGKLLKRNSGSWSIVSDYPSGLGGIKSLMVYNNKLYVGNYSSGPASIYSFDGKIWQNTGIGAGGGLGDVLALGRYRGKLYAGLGYTTGGSIWEYDGTSWRNSINFSSNDALAVNAFAVYNGKLYAGTGRGATDQDARVFEFDGNSWTLILSANAMTTPVTDPNPKDAVYSLAEYDKKLYIGLGGNVNTDGVVYKWSGGAPGLVGSTPTPSRPKVLALLAYNNMINAAWSGAVVNDGQVYYSSGVSWTARTGSAADEVKSLYEYIGKLYVSTADGDLADVKIQTFGNNGFIESKKTKWQQNVWYHLAGVYDQANNAMKILVNGAINADQPSNVSSDINNNNKPLYLGIGYGSDALSGVIDDFAVHHSVLSDTTIASHAGCYNLGQYLAPEYMGSLPIDPSSAVTDGTDTGYFISKDTGGVITITAPLTETTSSIPEIIKASR